MTASVQASELVQKLHRLEARVDSLIMIRVMADTLMNALRSHGYPVSDAHWEHNSEIMSREARDLHLAAVNLARALEVVRGLDACTPT